MDRPLVCFLHSCDPATLSTFAYLRPEISDRHVQHMLVGVEFVLGALVIFVRICASSFLFSRDRF